MSQLQARRFWRRRPLVWWQARGLGSPVPLCAGAAFSVFFSFFPTADRHLTQREMLSWAESHCTRTKGAFNTSTHQLYAAFFFPPLGPLCLYVLTSDRNFFSTFCFGNYSAWGFVEAFRSRGSILHKCSIIQCFNLNEKSHRGPQQPARRRPHEDVGRLRSLSAAAKVLSVETLPLEIQSHSLRQISLLHFSIRFPLFFVFNKTAKKKRKLIAAIQM